MTDHDCLRSSRRHVSILSKRLHILHVASKHIDPALEHIAEGMRRGIRHDLHEAQNNADYWFLTARGWCLSQEIGGDGFVAVKNGVRRRFVGKNRFRNALNWALKKEKT